MNLPWSPLLIGAAWAVILLVIGLAAIFFLWRVTRRRQQQNRINDRATVSPVGEVSSASDHPALAPEPETVPVTASGQVVENMVTVPSSINEAMAKTQPSSQGLKEANTVPTTASGQPITVPFSGQRPGRVCWQIAGLTDTGLKRELNEDNLLILEAEMDGAAPYGLYMVADGMGGHQAGEIASQLTVEAVRQQFTRQPLTPVTPFNDWLKNATLAANEMVLANQEDRTQERKMGSTLVMALVTEGQAHIANVGDSRAYHLTDESIEQISVDHSLVERLVQLGQLTREEARTHRQRNVIYNTIGDKADPEIGLHHVFLKPGERLLLCSDGLSTMLPDAEILAISHRYPSPAGACKALIEAAKAAGGDDNITVIVVQMDAA